MTLVRVSSSQKVTGQLGLGDNNSKNSITMLLNHLAHHWTIAKKLSLRFLIQRVIKILASCIAGIHKYQIQRQVAPKAYLLHKFNVAKSHIGGV